MEETTTDVAYGCALTSTIDYRNYLVLLALDEVIIGARGIDILRGVNTSDKLMKNCVILNAKVNDKNATVKVFKKYLHFCGVTRQEADMLATYVTTHIRDTQHVLSNPQKLEERLVLLQKEGSHFSTDEQRNAVAAYIAQEEICSSDLDHEPVNPTMTNHTAKVGCAIHTAKLLRILQGYRSKTRPWVLTYDNALSLTIRVFVPRRDSTKEGFVFLIQASGNIVYSSNETDEEACSIREEVKSVVMENLPQVAIRS